MTEEQLQSLWNIGASLKHVGAALTESHNHAKSHGSKTPLSPIDECLAVEDRNLRGDGQGAIADAVAALRVELEGRTMANHTHLVKALEAMSAAMIRDMPEHSTALQLKAEVDGLRAKVAALNSVNMSRSPVETPAAHALKVAKMARTLDREVTATMNRASQHWASGYNNAQRRIEEKVNLVPDALASEIREVFRGLNGKARSQLIKDLVDQNRGPELAALVRAPTVLTGLSEEQRKAFELSTIAKHAAAELDEQQKLEDVFSVVSSATRAAGSFTKELADPNRIATIEREAAAADAAGEAFNQSMQ